ncbi:hypothetical protein GY14_29975 [Delftia tsuruhatensis]|nr:hypothetical protein GY14_29975 [Delftia tsuruhatensis]
MRVMRFLSCGSGCDRKRLRQIPFSHQLNQAGRQTSKQLRTCVARLDKLDDRTDFTWRDLLAQIHQLLILLLRTGQQPAIERLMRPRTLIGRPDRQNLRVGHGCLQRNGDNRPWGTMVPGGR